MADSFIGSHRWHSRLMVVFGGDPRLTTSAPSPVSGGVGSRVAMFGGSSASASITNASSSSSTNLYSRQQSLFHGKGRFFKSLGLHVYSDVPPGPSMPQETFTWLDVELAAHLRDIFGVLPGQFLVVLVDKDGEMKVGDGMDTCILILWLAPPHLTKPPTSLLRCAQTGL